MICNFVLLLISGRTNYLAGGCNDCVFMLHVQYLRKTTVGLYLSYWRRTRKDIRSQRQYR